MGRFDALTRLEETPQKPTPSPVAPTVKPLKKKTHLLANQQTSKAVKPPPPQSDHTRNNPDTQPLLPPTPGRDESIDTSLLTTKEKTKYGTYLTEESIEKISIRAIQVKRDSHQIVQEAINQYFEKLEK